METRKKFNQLLCSSQDRISFKAFTSLILDEDPLFVPAYLEHLWLAEMNKDYVLYREVAHDALKAVRYLFSGKVGENYVKENWTEEELNSLLRLIKLLKEKPCNFSMSIRMELHAYEFMLKKKFHVVTQTTPTDNHLKLVTRVNCSPLQEEIESLPGYWWNVHTLRTSDNPYHQHTHSVLVRERSIKEIEYKGVDGVHESEPLGIVQRLPRLHETILGFAKENNLSLGKVAIVRMQPWGKAYRHFDHEQYYRGRNRYHLVISSGSSGNILSSGNETAEVHPGELWFFDNQVMHRAENNSEVIRTHVIFDGFPLGKT